MHENLSANRARRALCILAAAAGLSGIAQAADPGVGDTEIVIGNSLTLQGGKNPYGVAALGGMMNYFDALNASGGIFGRKIVVRTLDDDNNNATAEANARKLVQDGVFLLFGPVEDGPSTAVMKAAVELKVPLFGPIAGPSALRRPFQPMVFPVQAERREEFRALMTWGQRIGLKTVAFFHADSEGGRHHVEDVNSIAKELAMQLLLPLPVKADATDADFDRMVKAMQAAKPDMIFNHGAPGPYQKLVTKAKQAGLKTTYMGVNSGSSQIVQRVGPLAQGMVFAQVVPSPWERKREITREYQDATLKANPDVEFSYAGLEGFMTAKALAMALKATGRNLSRASLIKTLESSTFDLGGVKMRHTPDEHEGSRFVDISLVARDGRFIH
ncbi:MAG: ABC transporter substrate-binding protein [Burkholderiaceae bacterium]|nr:ABC transporter substrate-binding protein [Burkholderiaceae bacterium]